MAFIGMDVQQVRTLAQQMDQAAQQIHDIMSRLSGNLQNAQWVGNDASKFRSDWQSMHCRSLTGVAEALRHASTVAKTNATEQETASSH